MQPVNSKPVAKIQVRSEETGDAKIIDITYEALLSIKFKSELHRWYKRFV